MPESITIDGLPFSFSADRVMLIMAKKDPSALIRLKCGSAERQMAERGGIMDYRLQQIFQIGRFYRIPLFAVYDIFDRFLHFPSTCQRAE